MTAAVGSMMDKLQNNPSQVDQSQYFETHLSSGLSADKEMRYTELVEKGSTRTLGEQQELQQLDSERMANIIRDQQNSASNVTKPGSNISR